MRLFLSYSEIDKGIVERLEEQLKSFGIVVLRDKKFLNPGEEWEEKIREQIRTCDGVIVVVSHNSIESHNVTDEVIKARSFHKIIYPFLINDAPHFPILKDLQHYVYDGNISEEEISKIFGFDSGIENKDSVANINSVVKKYKAGLSARHSTMNTLMQGVSIHIESVYVDCYLHDGIEYDSNSSVESDRFISSDLVKLFNGGLYIITGHPGTGKTWLLRYLTYTLCNNQDNYLPVYAHFKSYNPNFLSFDEFLLSNVGVLLQQVEFNELLENYNCVLLLDGLDESTPEAYADAKIEINKLISRVPSLTIVITTRIYGFKNIREVDYPSARFYTIMPIDDSIIRKYIKRWFNTSSDEYIDALYNKIIGNIRVHELAQQAIFILCLMCVVYKAENKLTASISDLYKKAISLLMDSRRCVTAKERNLRMEVLKNLGLRFLEMQQTSFEKYLAEGITQSIIVGKTHKSTQEFLDNLIEDTGLLQFYEDQYSFIHFSFQEYFAALTAFENRIFSEENLLGFANINLWEETFKMYADLLKDEARKESYLHALSKKNLSLALRVAANCGNLGRKVLRDIIISTSSSDKLRMIQDIKSSLSSIRFDVAQRLVVQTLGPLISIEQDSNVLYFSIDLLKQYDPDDIYKIMYDNFYKYQNEKLSTLLSDPDYLFELVDIPDGSFIMGDDSSIDWNEKPAHRVYVDAFRISKYQLSNKAYEYIMNRDSSCRHEQYSSDDDQPVIQVDWYDAYICALRIGCRLPTEAEWEYAARATTETKWCFGDDEEEIIKYAHCYESNAEKTRKVNEGIPNKWGLYNVHGNVWEWCSDWFARYSSGTQVNPKGPAHGELRVRRGGGWLYHARGCKSSFRYGNTPNYKYNDIGIRLAK